MQCRAGDTLGGYKKTNVACYRLLAVFLDTIDQWTWT